MIVFLTLCYCAVLAVLLKQEVVKPTALVKASPVVVLLLLNVFLAIPLQFWAPAGPARVILYSVQITPPVGGTVVEVPIAPNAPLKQGDVLFQIDPVPYQARLKQARAQLELTKTRLAQAEKLATAQAGNVYDVQRYTAEVAQLEAAVELAEIDLNDCTVRAPGDGFATHVALRPGHEVGGAPVLSYYETHERLLFAQIPEGYLRYVEADQAAEVSFTMLPGEVFAATVDSVVPATEQGSLSPSGLATGPQSVSPGAYHVRLRLDDPEVLTRLPAGAVGSAAAFTDHGKPAHVIRKVMLRMDAWMNYVYPF